MCNPCAELAADLRSLSLESVLGGSAAAYPGYSNHQNGIALDIDVVSDASYNWMYANGTRFGFKDTVAGEPWHWEYRR